MFHKIFSLFVLLMCCNQVKAQEVNNKNDKKINQYLGIQANGLIREIFNFGNSSTIINNPYLVTYSFNGSKSGWGMSLGLGYDIDKFESGDDTFERTTNISNLSSRIGIERKRPFYNNKVVLSYGVDLLIGRSKSKTDSRSEVELNDDFVGNNIVETETSLKLWGLGPRFSVNYNLGANVIVGTEASYYFKKVKPMRAAIFQHNL